MFLPPISPQLRDPVLDRPLGDVFCARSHLSMCPGGVGSCVPARRCCAKEPSAIGNIMGRQPSFRGVAALVRTAHRMPEVRRRKFDPTFHQPTPPVQSGECSPDLSWQDLSLSPSIHSSPKEPGDWKSRARRSTSTRKRLLPALTKSMSSLKISPSLSPPRLPPLLPPSPLGNEMLLIRQPSSILDEDGMEKFVGQDQGKIRKEMARIRALLDDTESETYGGSGPIKRGRATRQSGRGVPKSHLPIDMLICSCGNSFASDACFCRKCGARRPDGRHLRDRHALQVLEMVPELIPHGLSCLQLGEVSSPKAVSTSEVALETACPDASYPQLASESPSASPCGAGENTERENLKTDPIVTGDVQSDSGMTWDCGRPRAQSADAACSPTTFVPYQDVGPHNGTANPRTVTWRTRIESHIPPEQLLEECVDTQLGAKVLVSRASSGRRSAGKACSWDASLSESAVSGGATTKATQRSHTKTEEAITALRLHIRAKFGSPAAVYKAFDLNGNGKLSLSELECGLDRIGVPWRELCGCQRLSKLFAALDSNHDAELTVKEMMGIGLDDMERLHDEEDDGWAFLNTGEKWRKWCALTVQDEKQFSRQPHWSPNWTSCRMVRGLEEKHETAHHRMRICIKQGQHKTPAGLQMTLGSFPLRFDDDSAHNYRVELLESVDSQSKRIRRALGEVSSKRGVVKQCSKAMRAMDSASRMRHFHESIDEKKDEEKKTLFALDQVDCGEETLSPEERQLRNTARRLGIPLLDAEAIQATFQAFDRDSSGFIDRQEFPRMLRSLLGSSVQLSEAWVKELFRSVDSDGDSRIAFQEYLVWHHETFGSPLLSMKAPSEHRIGSIASAAPPGERGGGGRQQRKTPSTTTPSTRSH